jgi:outer membrane cobalamin receptor
MHLPMSWYIALRIDNLLNTDYQLTYSRSTPRRGDCLTLGRQQR